MTAATVLTARALLLDMDGTLVNSDAAVERVWRRWAERHGLDGTALMSCFTGRKRISYSWFVTLGNCF